MSLILGPDRECDYLDERNEDFSNEDFGSSSFCSSSFKAVSFFLRLSVPLPL